MMDWEYTSDPFENVSGYVHITTEGIKYDVLYWDNGFLAVYYPVGCNHLNHLRGGGYITKYCRIGCSLLVGSPPKECQFATREEAIAICEKHYKLLVLQ